MWHVSFKTHIYCSFFSKFSSFNLHYQEAIFRTLAAILHLGNIEFSPGKEHDSSVIKDQKSGFHMQMAASLFRWVIYNRVCKIFLFECLSSVICLLYEIGIVNSFLMFTVLIFSLVEGRFFCGKRYRLCLERFFESLRYVFLLLLL